MASKVWDDYWSHLEDRRWELNRPQARILQRIGIEGKRILEIGFGSGTTSSYLAENGASVVGIDISLPALRNAKGRGATFAILCADGRALPFPDSSFDIVFHQGVLEHFRDPLPLLKEQGRVLRKGGALVVDVPQKYQLYTLMKRKKMREGTWPFGWETEYSYFQLKKLLEILGFKVRGHYANGYHPEWFRLLRIAHTIGQRRFGRPVMPNAVGRVYDWLWQQLELSLPACFFLVAVGVWGEKT